jgi:hypothetical protein
MYILVILTSFTLEFIIQPSLIGFIFVRVQLEGYMPLYYNKVKWEC